MTLLSIDTRLLRKPTHGAHYKNGKTIFSLWAPNAQEVSVRFSDGNEIPLDSYDDGWFSKVIGCRPGAKYKFVINRDLTVPDPAAYAQCDDVHGWSKVIDHGAYQWKTHHWYGKPWYQTVIYELHVGLLEGFSGVKKQLPSLVELGVTAIQLMPLGEFVGTRNWGYDGVLPFAPESSYGTPEELKGLIDYAHQLGLMVFVDVVYNHFGPEGNYIGQYASKFFRSDVKTPWGNAIDFRRPQVQQYYIENALMWVRNYRVDGLRFDAVHAINDNDFLIKLADTLHRATPRGRYLHLMLENENNSCQLLENGFIAQWNDDGHNILHHLLTGEKEGYYGNFSDSPTTKLARCLREGFIFQGDDCRTRKSRGEPSAHLSPLAFILFLQNHDQVGNRALGERLTQLADPDNLKAAITLMLLSPMIPLLFMGEELGLEQPFYYFTDHPEELALAVREGRRKEFASFTAHQSSDQESLPDPNDVCTFETSKPLYSKLNKQQQEWRDFYRTLLRLRCLDIIPRLPGTYSTGVEILGEGAVTASWMMGDGSQLRIDVNFSEQSVAVKKPWNRSRVLFNQGVDSLSHMENFLPKHCALVTLDDGCKC
jgi:maltooligosyltrehalose trehalohydrolase